MSTKRIILISGYARSGKDSLANALEKHLAHREPVRVKFANVLKTALGVALQRIGLDVDVFTEDEQQKQAIRPLLVEFGKFARSVDKDVFVKAAWADICSLFANGKGVVIVPDLRYANEINLISEWAAEEVWAVTHLRICRMGNQAANDEELHSINTLPSPDAVRIFADGNVDGIADWAEELCRKPGLPYEIQMPPVASEAAKEAMRKATAAGPVHPWTAWAEKEKAFFKLNNTQPMFTKPWEEEIRALDATIDKLSQRVDTDRANLEGHEQDIGKLEERIKQLEQQVANQNLALNRVANVFDTYLSRNAYYHVLQALEGNAK